jgi:diaminopimelate decarboxylase
VYDLQRRRRGAGDAASAPPGRDLAFAVKANASGACCPPRGAGVGAEAITVGELARALRAGVDPAGIVVGGPAQDAALRALTRGRGVAAHQPRLGRQWRDWLPTRAAGPPGARAFVRVNPGSTRARTSTWRSARRLEVRPGARRGAGAGARGPAAGVLAGFHVHAGSQLTDPAVHEGVLAALDAALRRPAAGARELDLGGGFALPGYPLERLGALIAPA